MTKFHILNSGSCKQIEKLTNLSSPLKLVDFPALFFLIQHEKWGNILVDTGYSPHFFEETKHFPYSIYASITPVNFDESHDAVNQIKRLGLTANDIDYLFITHFHADHIAGLKNFPKSKFICSKEAYFHLRNKKGISALREAFIPGLLPDDFEDRVVYIEEKPKGKIRDQFRDVYDIFGDESFKAVNLTGHAVGQFGLFFETENQAIFLIADASWDSDAYRNYHLPSKLTKLIMYDFNMFQDNLKRIHAFHKENQEVIIIPSHYREIQTSRG